jgi:glycosyltransferase involved in cell wall biosynthesis
MEHNLNNHSFGINVAGFMKGEFGLGQGARANVSSITAAGIPHVVNSFNASWHRNSDASYAEKFTFDNPYPVNLINVNAESLPAFIEAFGEKYFQNKYNIGFWAWEMPIFPPEWQFAFDYFDEIWTYSNHCAEAISTVSPVPVFKVMASIDLPQPTIDKNELKLPKDKFIFLFMFDSLSTFERKNPSAIVKAFIKAFGESDEVLLVIKFSNSQYAPQQRDEFKALVANYPSIHLIEGHLSREEIYALVNNCDCYVSLHRAEGFGLTMAEAMFYGKPVIATAYSSTMEFMNVGNSFLVKYDLVTLNEDAGPYKKGNFWADADIDHAATLMKYVFENPQQAQQVGARAAREVRNLLSPQVIGNRIKHRLEQITKVKRNYRPFQVTDNFEFQAEAWKKTAARLYIELQQTRLEVKKS